MPIIFGRQLGGGGGGGGGITSLAGAGSGQTVAVWVSQSALSNSGDEKITDLAPLPYYLQGQSAWSQATVNTAGANAIVAGGLGRRLFTIATNTGLATKTLLVTANGTLVTLTATAGAPGADQFQVGTDDTAPQLAVTATNLAAAIVAEATLGPLMTATAINANCYIDKKATLYSIVIASGTAGALVTATSGTDGSLAFLGASESFSSPLRLADGSSSAPTLSRTAATNTGFYWASNTVFYSSSGTTAFSGGYDSGAGGGSFGLNGTGSYFFWNGGDTIMARASAGFPQLVQQKLTAGTMTQTSVGALAKVWSRYDWTNAMIVALGGGGAGDIAVATLPAKTIVTSAYIVINTPDSSANALTVACGRVGAGYIDYIVASDAKAAASTIYGDASGERGTNLTGYDLPSYTGTTVVNCHFVKTTTALNTVTGSTGSVFIESAILP